MITITHHTGDTQMFNKLKKIVVDLEALHAKRKAIRETIKELSKLSDAELRDIGIARGEIWDIAHQDVNDNLKGWV